MQTKSKNRSGRHSSRTGFSDKRDEVQEVPSEVMQASAAVENLRIPLPDEVENDNEIIESGRKKDSGNIFSIFENIGLDDIIIIGLILILLAEKVEDDFLIIILLFLLLA